MIYKTHNIYINTFLVFQKTLEYANPVYRTHGQNHVHTHTCTHMCARAHTDVYFFPIGIHAPPNFKSQGNIIYYLKYIVFLPKIAHLHGKKLLPACLLVFPDSNSRL